MIPYLITYLERTVELHAELNPGVHPDDPRLARQHLQNCYSKHHATLRNLLEGLRQEGERIYRTEDE